MSGKLILCSKYNYPTKKMEGSYVFDITYLGLNLNLERLRYLAPSSALFTYMKSNALNKEVATNFACTYYKEINYNNMSQRELKYVRRLLDEGNTVYLVCACKSFLFCHRTLLGKVFEKWGYTVVYR